MIVGVLAGDGAFDLIETSLQVSETFMTSFIVLSETKDVRTRRWVMKVIVLRVHSLELTSEIGSFSLFGPVPLDTVPCIAPSGRRACVVRCIYIEDHCER